jgi:hypothetical protein
MPPDGWLTDGAQVVHRAFGTGTVAHVGVYKNVRAVWVDFDAGMRKLLEIQHALPYLRPRRPEDATSPTDPAQRCDVCGARPVVVTVSGPSGTSRACQAHRASVGKLARDAAGWEHALGADNGSSGWAALHPAAVPQACQNERETKVTGGQSRHVRPGGELLLRSHRRP